MTVLIASLFLLTILITFTISLPNSNGYKSSTQNKLLSVTASCDTKFFNITIEMDKPFKGVLFAREFSQKCRTFGHFSKSLILNVPTTSCGISFGRDQRLQKMYYMLTVVLQQDKFLRQISDQSKKIRCYVEDDIFQVKSKNMEIALNNLIYDVNHRKGRMKAERINKVKTGASHVIDNTLADALKAARAWMEIMPTKQNEDIDVLKVGEPALLVVKSTLPVGIGWRVVDCLAHDGLGDSSQKLLDENGCPVDELLLPALFKRPAKPIALMKHQEAVSKFAAFKFPDRDRLHLSCGLQLCRTACPQVDCVNRNQSLMNDNRTGRILSGLTGDILDRLEVFNSIEVRAPEIELQEDYINFETNYGKYVSPFGNIPGDKTFCVSPSNMALSFCIVGLVFLCAVFMAAWSLLRARRTNANIPYYTKSLFSSSTYSGYGGSKLLLHESPHVSHRSRDINSYGRIF